MTIVSRISILCTPLYYDDEDFYDSKFINIVFYDISSLIPSTSEEYGIGTIIISDGFKYFTQIDVITLVESIRLAQASDGINLLYRN